MNVLIFVWGKQLFYMCNETLFVLVARNAIRTRRTKRYRLELYMNTWNKNEIVPLALLFYLYYVALLFIPFRRRRQASPRWWRLLTTQPPPPGLLCGFAFHPFPKKASSITKVVKAADHTASTTWLTMWLCFSSLSKEGVKHHQGGEGCWPHSLHHLACYVALLSPLSKEGVKLHQIVVKAADHIASTTWLWAHSHNTPSMAPHSPMQAPALKQKRHGGGVFRPKEHQADYTA